MKSLLILVFLISLVSCGKNAHLVVLKTESNLSCEQLITNGDFEASTDDVGLVHGVQVSELGTKDNSFWDVYDQIEGFYTVDNTSGIELQKRSDNTIVELDSHRNKQNGSNTNSSMLQNITVDQDGLYHLQLDYAPRRSLNDKIEIEIDGVSVDLGLDNLNLVVGKFTKITKVIRLDAGYHELVIKATGPQDSYGSLIDNLSLKRCGCE